MKKLLVLLLAFALLLPALVSCQDDGPDTPDLPEGNPVLLVLPEDVNMISIYLYGGGNGGAAYFDKNNYGVLLQLLLVRLSLADAAQFAGYAVEGELKKEKSRYLPDLSV